MAHIEKTKNGEYIIVNNNNGKREAGPFALRATAEAEIAKREREKREAAHKVKLT